MHVWKKRVPLDAVDGWTERLGALVEPGRIVLLERPDGRSPRLEVYVETEAEARALQRRCNGQVSEVRPESWQPAPTTAPGKPLSIGGRLLVTSREHELEPLRRAHPDKQVLCVPAAMAFGTGEHATTSMCLRLLLDVARKRRAEDWELLDLGMGSGILALAGKMFGAHQVLGLDNDPHAVRTAKENASLNGLASRQVRFARVELPDWRRKTNQVWPVVTANLFSELLIQLMPKIIEPVVAPGGDLILSGVLGTQAQAVVSAVKCAGFRLVTTKSRGRWRAFQCSKPEG